MTTNVLRPTSEEPHPLVALADRPAPWRGWFVHGGVAILFLLFSIGMTWPLATDLPHRLVSWGDPVFQAWTMAWDVHAWTTDPLHVFNANVFYPYRNTLAYSDHLFGQAFLVAPVLLATGNAILADNLAVLLALALSGFAMYLLVLDLTGSRLAGVVAGAVYAFAPARMSHLEHLHLLSAQWLPLGLLAGRRTLQTRSWRWPVMLGVVIFLQGLFGVYYLYFLLVLLGVLFGFYLLGFPRRPTLIATGRAVIACGIGVLLLLPTLLPYLQVHEDLGVERTVQEVTQWQAQATDYLAVSPRNRLYGEILGTRYSRHLEQELFPGLLLLTLAGLGLFNRRVGWERWMLLVLASLSVLLSFGLAWTIFGREIPLPYQLLYDLVPGFRAIRVPARFALLALVGLGALAGLGVDLFLRSIWGPAISFRFRRPGPLALTVLLLAALVAEYSTVVALPSPLPATLAEAQRRDYQWLAEHPAPTIEFPMGEGPVASAWPNFWSTLHWNPVVNGYSGVTPPAYYVFRERMRAFPSRDTIRLLQGIGIHNVVYHAEPTVPPERDPFLQRAASFSELRQVVGGPDYVFQLQKDPWLWGIAGRVPDGQAVDLPALEHDPATFGMLAAILQREGHPVYGAGTLDYWHLTQAPPSTCYAILPETMRPEELGYAEARELHAAGGLVLYQDRVCSPSST